MLLFVRQWKNYFEFNDLLHQPMPIFGCFAIRRRVARLSCATSFLEGRSAMRVARARVGGPLCSLPPGTVILQWVGDTVGFAGNREQILSCRWWHWIWRFTIVYGQLPSSMTVLFEFDDKHSYFILVKKK